MRGCWRCGIVEAPSFIVVFGLVVDNDFHFFCKIEEFILRVLKIVFNGEGFKDVVEGLFFEINAQFGEGIVKTSAPILGATFARLSHVSLPKEFLDYFSAVFSFLSKKTSEW